ncbi:MAG: CDP-glycerol glycerophosphotransferase family protein [Selenomonadaceae bacterium]|nr:CDP-glycerol glycerophosphotransferase family protein [Selenomonadaceae bacterium]
MPPNVRCQNVSRFAKTCYVPYAVISNEQFVGFTLNNFNFFNNLNFYFSDCEGFAEISRQVYETSAENSDQHFMCLGSPEVEEFCKSFAQEFETNLNKKRNSVMWAPRWTYGSTMGGSHFIEYKENFVALRKKYSNLKMTIRPHRLLFPTMVKEKRMTEDDVQRYKKSLQENKIYLDEYDSLQSAFTQADIMIADITSIIPLYFLTGNPIIYCDSGYNFFGDSKLIEPAIYKAESWEDVEKYLAMLLKGEDPLKDERRRLIKQLNQIHDGAAEKIAQCIIDDYYRN